MAAKNGHFEIVKLLVEHGAEIDDLTCAIGNQELTPIHIAAKNGHASIVNFILLHCKIPSKVANVPLKQSGSTSLHLAAMGGHIETARILLASGANFFAKNKYGDMFLHNAIRNEHTDFCEEILAYFLENSASLMKVDQLQEKYPLDIENNQEKCTPYMLAVLRELFKVADIFFDNKLANPHYQNQNNESVFDIVSKHKIRNVQKYIIEQGNKIKNFKPGVPT